MTSARVRTAPSFDPDCEPACHQLGLGPDLPSTRNGHWRLIASGSDRTFPQPVLGTGVSSPRIRTGPSFSPDLEPACHQLGFGRDLPSTRTGHWRLIASGSDRTLPQPVLGTSVCSARGRTAPSFDLDWERACHQLGLGPDLPLTWPRPGLPTDRRENRLSLHFSRSLCASRLQTTITPSLSCAPGALA